MREFKCSSIGHNCGWKQQARTEDLLMDMVAIHMRERHGMPALSQDRVAAIKHAFSKAEPVTTATDEPSPALKEVSCRDLGMNCGFRFIAKTEDLIADGIAMHAREAHGIKVFTAEMATRAKNLAHEWKG